MQGKTVRNIVTQIKKHVFPQWHQRRKWRATLEDVRADKQFWTNEIEVLDSRCDEADGSQDLQDDLLQQREYCVDMLRGLSLRADTIEHVLQGGQPPPWQV